MARVPAWAIALGALIASFLLLALCVDVPPLHEDTSRDLSIARDCVDAGRCAMAGPTSSFGGLTQGALWIHLLELSRFVGLEIGGVRTVVLGLASMATVLVAFTPPRLCGWSAGPATWALALAMTPAAIELPVLWNPSVLPLPIALFEIALLVLAATADVKVAAAMGVFLSLSIDAHLVCAGWVPFALGVVVATARRPWLATVVAAASMVGAFLVSSVGTVRADLPILAAWSFRLAALAVVALTLGLAVRRRARAAAVTSRVRVVLAASCVYFVLGVVCVCVATGQPLAPRYFAPVVPAAAMLVAGAAVGGFGRRRSGSRRASLGNVAAVALVAILGLRTVVLHRAPAHPAWAAADVDPLARSLAARGWTFGGLYGHLRGPQARLLLAALGPYLPAPDGMPRAPAQDDLLLLKASRAEVQAKDAESWVLADLPGNDAAVGRGARSWLDVGSMEICVGPSGSDVRCLRTGLDDDDPDRGATGTFSQRAYPEMEGVRRKLAPDPGSRHVALRWTLAVRLRPNLAPPAHVLSLADADPPWRIERVDGARYAGTLPARELVLESVSDDGRILFGVEVMADDAGRFRPWLPDLIETAADEETMRSLSPNQPRRSR
jgi:hypothetical protein